MILYVLLGIIGYIALVVTGNVVGGLLMKSIAKSPRLIEFFGLDPSDYEEEETVGTDNLKGGKNND
jgi:hypothetical protein